MSSDDGETVDAEKVKTMAEQVVHDHPALRVQPVPPNDIGPKPTTRRTDVSWAGVIQGR